MNYLDAIIAVISALSGSGVSWVLFFRRKVRREGANLDKEEFNAVSETVRQAANDLKELSARIGELEREKIQVLEDNSNLRKENERLTTALRKYIRHNNPGME